MARATKPWRWAAWLASAAVFAAHLWYEHSAAEAHPLGQPRASVPPSRWARFCWPPGSTFTAGGWTQGTSVRWALLALMAFPLGTGLPAFVAALLALAAAARWRR
jgi:hypothetical protein